MSRGAVEREGLADVAGRDEALEEALSWYGMICQYDPSNDKGWIGVGTLCKRSGRASTAAWAFSNAAKASRSCSGTTSVLAEVIFD